MRIPPSTTSLLAFVSLAQLLGSTAFSPKSNFAGLKFSPSSKNANADFAILPAATITPGRRIESGISCRRQTTKLTMLSLPTEIISFIEQFNLSIDKEAAESLAGPFFGASLFPYLAFLYFLSREENECPKGVTVGFATCLLFVVLTIPAAIAAKILYGVSLADSDWLHGSAESLLTVTNLVTVIAFRQALAAKEKGIAMPKSAMSYAPMTWLVVVLTALATVTVAVPALASDTTVHTRYLGGFMDLPFTMEGLGAFAEPENALSVACWVIHVSSLVEYLVAMGFAWRWADIVENPTWKGLTWGLIPLHTSGIIACTSHLFYNQIPLLVPLQALLTCFGNTTAAWATYRIARSNGWKMDIPLVPTWLDLPPVDISNPPSSLGKKELQSLVGFEDLGDALAKDSDYSFLIKLIMGCAVASYAIKYGETFFAFPYEANVYLALAIIFVPSALNVFKWYKRSQDPTFQGWF
jgi:uncharacterized integral membrane protein